MVKYDGFSIVFQEVPNETSLAFNITDCQHRCVGCHSPWLRDDYGHPLLHDLPIILEYYQALVTCICFMGEGNDPKDLAQCVHLAHDCGFKTCVYSGDTENHWNLYHSTYFKYGPYIKEQGALDDPNTNQRFFDYSNPNDPQDKTYLFWRMKDICES